jgi:hypothetical protein
MPDWDGNEHPDANKLFSLCVNKFAVVRYHHVELLNPDFAGGTYRLQC